MKRTLASAPHRGYSQEGSAQLRMWRQSCLATVQDCPYWAAALGRLALGAVAQEQQPALLLGHVLLALLLLLRRRVALPQHLRVYRPWALACARTPLSKPCYVTHPFRY